MITSIQLYSTILFSFTIIEIRNYLIN